MVVFYSGFVPGQYQVRNMFVTGSTPQADHQRSESFFRFRDFRLIYFSVCTYCRRYLFNLNWLTLRCFFFLSRSNFDLELQKRPPSQLWSGSSELRAPQEI